MKVTVAGEMTDAMFHKAAAIATTLSKQGKLQSECLVFFETQWH